MNINDKLLDLMWDADSARQVAFKRHLCEEILEANPNHKIVLIIYAGVLIDLSLYDQAEKVLDHAFTLSKKLRPQVFAQQGHRLKRMGDYAGAEAQYLKANEIDPGDASYLIFAGTAAFRRGEIGQAVAHARGAVLCSEGCLDEAFSNLGGYLMVQRNYDEARLCYLRALEITPDFQPAKKRLLDLDLLEAHLAKRKRQITLRIALTHKE